MNSVLSSVIDSNSFEKKPTVMFFSSLLSSIHRPSSVMSASILFCRRLTIVEVWKNLVLSSPSFSQSHHDFYSHRISSCLSIIALSSLSSFSSSIKWVVAFLAIAHWIPPSRSSFRIFRLKIFPKVASFQALNLTASSFKAEERPFSPHHSFFIHSPNSACSVQAASNQNGLFPRSSEPPSSSIISNGQ